MSPETNLTLRYMQISDIPDVVEIDRQAFSQPWPARSYQFEVRESNISYMVVLEKEEEQPIQGIKRIFLNLSGQGETIEEQSVIVGYGGLWKIADEAHISTIATHPDYRGQGYGEIVLAGMIKRAVELEAEYIVLEVRVSNDVAQSLYRKYGFEVEGVKPNYYHQDKEDAYDMRLLLTPENIATFREQYEALRKRRCFQDNYTEIPHPRTGK